MKKIILTFALGLFAFSSSINANVSDNHSDQIVYEFDDSINCDAVAIQVLLVQTDAGVKFENALPSAMSSYRGCTGQENGVTNWESAESFERFLTEFYG
ncbi:MAG: hypothetical protein ACQESK_06400 [Bacteroidota bacterium]